MRANRRAVPSPGPSSPALYCASRLSALFNMLIDRRISGVRVARRAFIYINEPRSRDANMADDDDGRTATVDEAANAVGPPPAATEF